MADNRRETAVSFSWSATLKHLVIGVVVTLIGVAMLQADVLLFKLIGVLAVVCGAGMTVMLPFSGGVHTARCPICGAEIEVLMKSGLYLECAKCEEYFEASKGKMWQMDEAHVADKAKFKVRLPWWDDLRTPTGKTITVGGAQDYVEDALRDALLTRKIPGRTVSAIWPATCCVCGSAPTRYESLAQEVSAAQETNFTPRDTTLIVRVEGIPHCDRHEKGVEFAESIGQMGRVLFFRSYAYRNAFRRANPWQITWK